MKGGKEEVLHEMPLTLIEMEKPYTQKYAVDDIPQPRHSTQDIYVRAVVKSAGIGNGITSSAQFYYSFDGKKYVELGSPFKVILLSYHIFKEQKTFLCSLSNTRYDFSLSGIEYENAAFFYVSM